MKLASAVVVLAATTAPADAFAVHRSLPHRARALPVRPTSAHHLRLANVRMDEVEAKAAWLAKQDMPKWGPSAAQTNGLVDAARTGLSLGGIVVADVALRRAFAARAISFPSSLAGFLLTSVLLIVLQSIHAPTAQRIFQAAQPGCALLTKWLAVFFVPNLVLLPLVITMSASDLGRLGVLILCGVATALPLAGLSAGAMLRAQADAPAPSGFDWGAPAAAAKPAKPFSDATLKLLAAAAAGSGAVALAANRAPAAALGPLAAWLPFASRYVHLLSTTLAAFAAGAALVPKRFQKVLHPLVSCTGATLGAIGLLAAATGLPASGVLRGYLLPGRGALAAPGNLLLAMLGPATFSFGFMIFQRRALLGANAAAVSACVGVSSAAGLLGTAALANALQLPAAVRLASVSRQVTAPLAIAIAGLLGADPSLAATIVVLTGLVVANFGAAALDALGVRAPVARGLAMGAAGHGLGTAATSGEPDAFPFAAIAMALNAALSTVLVSLPPFRRLLRAAAGVP